MDYDEVDIIISDMETDTEEESQASVPKQSREGNDVVDVKPTPISYVKDNKPGRIHPSKMTDELYYDSNANRGIALIFNHEKFKGKVNRNGTKKDGDDLKAVLEGLQFDVRYYMDLKAEDVKNVLYKVSMEDHSKNDCLLVTVMSHGTENGTIAAADEDYFVEELWENFVGDNCKTLTGKPKLFFIQACRGILVDPGVIFKPKQAPLERMEPITGCDEVDAQLTDPVFVIPKLDDLLVMYSTADGYYSFRNSTNGSWFIQALCEELKTNSDEDLMRILSGVNRRVAYGINGNFENKTAKQMPIIVSMLTKIMYFQRKNNNVRYKGTDVDVRSMGNISNDCDNKPGHIQPSKMNKDLYYDISHANRGVAIIFIQERCNGELRKVQEDGDKLKAVLLELQFDVRDYLDLTLGQIREVLLSVSREDHSNNDCLLVTILSLGTKDGKVYSSDWNFSAYELWENFLGDNCRSLVGKPKLFLVEACRGVLTDPSVLLKRPQTFDSLDSNLSKPTFVISNTADLLVMYSTAKGHYAFRNPGDGSWFIQALCEELKADLQEDLLHILTRVNKKVSNKNQANVSFNHGAAKQMPNIVSMLTKTMYFTKKTMKLNFENA